MNMRQVNSSNILAVGYDFDTETLAVEFKGSGRYHYEGVAPAIYAGFFDPEVYGGSVGGYFHRAVRGKFPSVKLAA